MPYRAQKISYSTLLSVSLVFVLLFTILALILISRGHRDRRWIEQRRKMDAELTGILASMHEMEAAQREYLLTHEKNVTRDYRKAETQAFLHLANSFPLTLDVSAQQQRLHRLEILMKKQKELLDKSLGDTSPNAVNNTLIVATDNHIMDNIEATVDSLREYEHDLLQEGIKNVDSFDIGSLLIVITFSIVAILVIVYSYISLNVQVREKKMIEEHRQQILDELAASEARYRNLFDASNDAIIIANHAGQIVSWNSTAQNIFGYTHSEIEGEPVSLIIPEKLQKQGKKGMQNILAHGPDMFGSRIEMTGLRQNGEEFPIEVTLSQWNIEGNYYFSASIRDITAQKYAQEKLIIAMDELKRSNEDLSQFAYVASHDLQEPLRKIRAFGDLLKSKNTTTDNIETENEYINRMVNAAGRMQNLINDLLSFSRVSRDADHKTTVDLNEVVATVIDDLEIAINKAGGKITIHSLPVLKAASPTQMHQLFLNLLSNALKFRKPDVAPQIEVSCNLLKGSMLKYEELSVVSGKKYYHITISDNGIGFNIKYLEKIFTIFQRLHGKSEYEGTGIGLAVCRKICENHNGFITARKTDTGSDFIVILPAN